LSRIEVSAVEMLRTVGALREKRAGETVALVPTMGALHDGHISLMQTAKARADRLVVSIFVNPTQFGAGEDLEAYPRTEASDLEKLGHFGADVAFCPPASEM